MRRNQFIGKGLSTIALLLISQLCTAGGETTKSPILDRVEVMHTAPENLEELSLIHLYKGIGHG